MDLLEQLGKQLLAGSGIAVPRGKTVTTSEECETVARELGSAVVLKCQVPVGRRGRSGGIRFASTPAQARDEGNQLLGSVLGGFQVAELLVEQRVDVVREMYAAILNDPASKGPMLVFSTEGGMDIEEVNRLSPEKVLRIPLDIRSGLLPQDALGLLSATDLPTPQQIAVSDSLVRLYDVYRRADAELVEVNPLVLTTRQDIIALDAKVSLDDSAGGRRPELLKALVEQVPDRATDLERQARMLGLTYIELDGSVGVLANGAGLTMTTLDAINYFGGKPANFLEIGGDAYTKATPALRLVLANPRVQSVLVNFCGAFARTDVMTEGVVAAIEGLKPSVPIFFSIHGTAEEEATALLRDRLNIESYDLMDDAVRAAVEAAAGGQA